ncbi:MAG: hypothetical protein WAQ24_05065 [Candidatus Saccharimonadales bacterium]
MFGISLTNTVPSKECHIDGYVPVEAVISLDSHKEHIDIQTGFWTLRDYVAQWRSAVNLLAEGDSSKSILITQFLDPSKRERGHCIEGWPLYVELKPHNKAAMNKGVRQLQRYVSNDPQGRSGSLWTYKKTWRGNYKYKCQRGC